MWGNIFFPHLCFAWEVTSVTRVPLEASSHFEGRAKMTPNTSVEGGKSDSSIPLLSIVLDILYYIVLDILYYIFDLYKEILNKYRNKNLVIIQQYLMR